MKLSHEYNEYVIGFVVTDQETNRSVNFQLEEITSNHPSPDFEFTHSCEADETNENFTAEELEEAQEYLDAQDDVIRLLSEINEAKDRIGNYEVKQKISDINSKSNSGVSEFDLKNLGEE